MGTILRGLQSVLIALGIIAVVTTGVILYYNTVKPEDEEPAQTAMAETEAPAAETETNDIDIETEEEETDESDAANAESIQTSYIEGHEHTYKSSVIKPSTCSEPGEVKYTCYCGDTYVDAIKVKEHTPGAWVTVRAATDSQTGLRQKSCTVCGKVLEEETVPMLTTSSSTNKNDKNNSQTSDHVHSYTYEITEEATCTEKGVKTYTCSKCGSTFETKIAATNHPSRRTVRTEGDCANPGKIETVCNICDAVISSESIYYEHDWGSWIVTTAATSSKKGVKTRTCKDCGQVQTRSTSSTVVTANTGGSSSGGSSGGTSSGSGSNNGSSNGSSNGSTTCNHNYTSRVTANATCTSAGTTVKTCTLCGAVTTEAAPAALGHLSGNWKITKPATAETEGERVKYCTRCGEIAETETIAKVEEPHKHNFDDGKILKEATCVRSGTRKYTCKDCGYYYTSSIPATGIHTYDANGICSICGAAQPTP